MEIEQIAQATTGQRTNPLWHRMREKRLTGSCFGRALRAATSRNSNAVEEFRKEIFTPRNLTHIPAIKWGTDHEAVALAAYFELTGYKV